MPAALIRRMHEAKVKGAPQVSIWGTGTPRREFLYVDDLADACVFLMRRYSGDEMVNVGIGEDLTIAEFARTVADVVGFTGELDLRHLVSRRHAAQACRHDEAEGARLEGEDAAARGAREGV